MEGSAPEIKRIITLSSGASRGSNIMAIHRYFEDIHLPLTIHTAVFCSPKAEAISKCAAAGIAQQLIPYQNMHYFETQVLQLINSNNIALIALCGFMKRLSNEFLSALQIPILNVHPALLPKYGGKGMYGIKVHKAVFEAGEKISGATIHKVDPVYDHGEIVAQNVVNISDCGSAEEIAHKVLKLEHSIYAPAIYAVLTKS
ncbi:MAG: formyltransferase family protein [Candidatus Cloacimonetes bacterium]|nr:formyltransferase family protein [Candidatus Cloacimonadota bacterium]